MSKQYKACVLGAGAFGTAMANTASLNSYMSRVSLYARDKKVVDSINNLHRNPDNYPEFDLSLKISATNNLAEALKDSTYVLSCLPCQIMKPSLQENKHLFDKHVPFISCSKGINLQTGQLISEVVKEVLGSDTNYAVLSGPTFAAEIMQKFPTCIVVASENENTSKLIQLGLSSEFFRIFSQKDVVGVELAGALKNIIAIGAGIIEGAGYGTNSTTAFLARGMREMQLYGLHFGAQRSTFYGLAGIGDLMLTSFGKLSRNRQFGQRIGQGESLEQVTKSSKGVVEGLPTLEFVYKRSIELNLNMPLTNVIYELVHAKISHQEAMKRLMHQKFDEEFPPTFEDLLQ